MRKIVLSLMACFFAASAAAENESTYDPETGIVEIPEVIIIGQNEEFSVRMQQTEGLNFEVTEAIADEEGTSDSDELRATYDPATGMVEIPLVIVLDMTPGMLLETFSVKMEQREGLNFEVTEAIEAEVKNKINN